ncbi:MAG: 1-acyl-sn-glycerol-3-phosphate acyltransferase [Spirochaetales bacterium]|nr:1-acyl-sn-glycerol-3-phosphate acyltransferase [Spirochaetales bacterium]
MKLLYAVASLFTWFEIAFLFIVITPFQVVIFLLTTLFDRKRRLQYYHGAVYASIALFISPCFRVKVIGRENLDRSKPHVVVMNHQSLLDILLSFLLFYPSKMIGKKVLGKVPFVGWDLFLGGHILVDRKNRKSQFEAIRKMDKVLISGDSLLVYPEGTRTKDGKIAEFKKGVFRSASETGTAVLPVVIEGAYEALPKKGLIVEGRHILTLSVLPPIQVEKGSSTAELALECHDLMSAELERIRRARQE